MHYYFILILNFNNHLQLSVEYFMYLFILYIFFYHKMNDRILWVI